MGSLLSEQEWYNSDELSELIKGLEQVLFVLRNPMQVDLERFDSSLDERLGLAQGWMLTKAVVRHLMIVAHAKPQQGR